MRVNWKLALLGDEVSLWGQRRWSDLIHTGRTGTVEYCKLLPPSVRARERAELIYFRLFHTEIQLGCRGWHLLISG